MVQKTDRVEVSVPPDFPVDYISDDNFCLNSSNPIINDSQAIDSYTSTIYINGTPGTNLLYMTMAVNWFKPRFMIDFERN